MKEVEAKILEVDVDRVLALLKQFGAKKTFDGELVQHYFVKEGFDGVYRIREETGSREQIVVTIKTSTGESTDKIKVLEEKEHIAESKVYALKKAHEQGFSYYHTEKKHRVEFRVENTHIVFDTHHFPDGNTPTLLEIESPDKETVAAWAHKLGFSQDDLTNLSSKKFLKKYGKQWWNETPQ